MKILFDMHGAYQLSDLAGHDVASLLDSIGGATDSNGNDFCSNTMCIRVADLNVICEGPITVPLNAPCGENLVCPLNPNY